MLPEETQQFDNQHTVTLKPGQLAIVATGSTVQLQAISNQLVVSWDYFPRLSLVYLLQEYMDGTVFSLSLEEMMHSLSPNSGPYAKQAWYSLVNSTLVKGFAAVQEVLDPYPGMKQSTGICPNCNRHFHLYSCYCSQCNSSYCIWCRVWDGHPHQLLLVSNY
jgi:hypothetical protein